MSHKYNSVFGIRMRTIHIVLYYNIQIQHVTFWASTSYSHKVLCAFAILVWMKFNPCSIYTYISIKVKTYGQWAMHKMLCNAHKPTHRKGNMIKETHACVQRKYRIACVTSHASDNEYINSNELNYLDWWCVRMDFNITLYYSSMAFNWLYSSISLYIFKTHFFILAALT